MDNSQGINLSEYEVDHFFSLMYSEEEEGQELAEKLISLGLIETQATN